MPVRDRLIESRRTFLTVKSAPSCRGTLCVMAVRRLGQITTWPRRGLSPTADSPEFARGALHAARPGKPRNGRRTFALDVVLVDLMQLRRNTYGSSVGFQRRLFSTRVGGVMFAVTGGDIGVLRTLGAALPACKSSGTR